MYNYMYELDRFFFFKQKTAYEMRISDWSSDVCSSDLPRRQCRFAQPLLDQQGEHMDCEGVTKLVGTDRQRETVLLAPLAGTGEDHLPRVGANRLPYLGQP